jgi:hypothetical protein
MLAHLYPLPSVTQDGNLDNYSYSMLEDLHRNVKEKCNNYIKIIYEKLLSKVPRHTNQYEYDSTSDQPNFSKSKGYKEIFSGKSK